MTHKSKICNTCWTGIHITCDVQSFYKPEHLLQDLDVVKRHLEAMQNFTLISDVATIVPNFTQVFESFSDSFNIIEMEVKEAIKNKRDKEYNLLKDRIKE